jgi:hypothetical protein
MDGFIFLLWVGAAALTSWVAHHKGRGEVTWFVIALFLPLLSLVALAAVPARHRY